MVEEVRVKGFKVEIQLRIPLDEPPDDPTTSSTTPPNPAGPDNPARRSQRKASGQTAVSSQDRLRSVGGDERRQLQAEGQRPREGAYRRLSVTVIAGRGVSFHPARGGRSYNASSRQ
jgi:hypothetical protein